MPSKHRHPFAWALCGLLLVACQNEPSASSSAQSPATAVIAPTVAPTLAIAAARPLPGAESLPPLRLIIPALDLAIPVTPMAWRVNAVGGERLVEWEVPAASAGWHLNSIGAGGAGNVILSGHHVSGEAVFAPLARDEVKLDDQLILSDEAGHRFAYTVREISEPIPATGASAADQAKMADYLAASENAQLTLITGWPSFADTHYRVIVADFAGVVQSGN